MRLEAQNPEDSPSAGPLANQPHLFKDINEEEPSSMLQTIQTIEDNEQVADSNLDCDILLINTKGIPLTIDLLVLSPLLQDTLL